MAPKKSISEKQIIRSAFNMVRTIGAHRSTARKIALELGCSTMPIYSTIGSMHDVINQVLRLGYHWIEQLYYKIDSRCPLMDFELAIWKLALTEPHLWHLMFLHKTDSATRSFQFPEWLRIIQEVEQRLSSSIDPATLAATTRETRIRHLKDLSYTIFGVGASVHLGTFFYDDHQPENECRYMFTFFHRINTTCVPWYSNTPAMPKHIDTSYDETLTDILSSFE